MTDSSSILPVKVAVPNMRANGVFRARGLWPLLLMGVSCGAVLAACDKDKPAKPPVEQTKEAVPTLRIYAMSGPAGAIEPCGCVKDMLGGVDHAAAFIDAQKKKAPHSIVVGAGPMFFEDPHVAQEETAQVSFKAQTMAESLGDLGMLAWAPGANDWAGGVETLRELASRARAEPLAANLGKDAGPVSHSQVVERGSLRVGLVGVSVPEKVAQGVSFSVKDATQALLTEAKKVQEKGADLTVALIAAQRGAALRMIESASGQVPIQIAVLGKPYDQGEANDPPFAPELVGKTLTVQSPNHLQRLAVIDLYVKEGSVQFADGGGVSRDAEKERLRARIEELGARLQKWRQPDSQVSAEDLAAQEERLREWKGQLAALDEPPQPPEGSYFDYQLVDVKESFGTDERVAARMSAYYKRVNEHNKKVFADRLPPPIGDDQSSYLGVEACSECHQEEREFWDTTGHAHAYETLSSQHKEFNLDCVSCHVTGYEKPGGSTVTHVSQLKDVGCEVCHGPGSRHAQVPTNPDFIESQPSPKLCAESCHHPPHVGDEWQVGPAWQKIVGPGHGRPKN